MNVCVCTCVYVCVCVRVCTRVCLSVCLSVCVLFDAILPLPLSSGHTTDGPPMQKEALELQVGKQHCLLQQCKRMYMWGGVG